MTLQTGQHLLCSGCRQEFQPRRKDQRHCSDTCRQKAKRDRDKAKRDRKRQEQRSRLYVVPLALDVANEFVSRFHRHNEPVRGSKFNLGVVDETGMLRGVAIIGRPVARLLDDGWTLEVNRVATDGCANTCSALYGAARRVAFDLGYRRLVTYTLLDESGSSLRGAGWKRVAETKPSQGKGWQNRPGRKQQRVCELPKYRWEAVSPKSTQRLWTFTVVAYPWEVLQSAL
jgi:hypothetical protein